MLFTVTLRQMIFLFLLILIGFVLRKGRAVDQNAATVLSRLENFVLIPALVLGTFIEHFTLPNLERYAKLMLFSLVMMLISIPISIFLSRLVTKEGYLQKIYTYALVFSNFSFMGNAVVSAVFPSIFPEYLMFTLVLWIGIYAWGAPVLLIRGSEEGRGETESRSKRLRALAKSLCNPMLISMLVGMLIGILGSLIPQFAVPDFFSNAISSAGNCMSPIAMLLTGITFGGMDFQKVLQKKSIYIITLLRLLIFPLFFALLFGRLGIPGTRLLGDWIPLPDSFLQCFIVTLAMPAGLNTIVIPSAYGRDTSNAAGLALVSHLLGTFTIPLIFFLCS